MISNLFLGLDRSGLFLEEKKRAVNLPVELDNSPEPFVTAG